MKNEQFTKFIKDMSYTAKKVATSPEVLGQLDQAQLGALKMRLEAYSSLSPERRGYKTEALNHVAAEIKSRTEVVTTDLGEEAAKLVAENSTVLELHIRQPGFTKKIDSETFLDQNGNKGKVDADVLHVHQDLIDREFPKALLNLRAKCLEYVRAWEVPGGMLTLGGGQYLVPYSSLSSIYERIEQFTDERADLLDAFEAKWDAIVEDAKVKRGAFFNSADYPPFSAVRDRYLLDYRLIPHKVGDELKKAGDAVYMKEHESRMLACGQAAAGIQAALREGFYGLLEHFTERLGVDQETGKPKRFNEKRITDIKDFLETFAARNLTNDQELQNICTKAQALLEGVDAATIRKDEDVRSSLKQAFDELVETTDGLIEVRTRKVRVAGV